MINIKNLTKTYEGSMVPAVNNISFDIERGSICCIIGTSGCGKTTTLKMINRLVEPTSGEVWINEEECHMVDAIQWRRKIGYVIQKAGLLPHLTIKENISLLSKILKRDKAFIKQRTDELLEMIDLAPEEFSQRYPIELSGGQQQRVGIARALMEDPPILLMDEPFGALDPITRNSMHEEFIEMNKKLKKTIVMVTHDMDEAFKLGDQVVLMGNGNIVQRGNKDDFMNRPANKFVEDFVRSHFE